MTDGAGLDHSTPIELVFRQSQGRALSVALRAVKLALQDSSVRAFEMEIAGSRLRD